MRKELLSKNYPPESIEPETPRPVRESVPEHLKGDERYKLSRRFRNTYNRELVKWLKMDIERLKQLLLKHEETKVAINELDVTIIRLQHSQQELEQNIKYLREKMGMRG